MRQLQLKVYRLHGIIISNEHLYMYGHVVLLDRTAQCYSNRGRSFYYSVGIMNLIVSQITGVSTNYSTVCSGADVRKHQIFASLAFVRGIHR